MKIRLYFVLASITLSSIVAFGQCVMQSNTSRKNIFTNEFADVRFGTLTFCDVDNDNNQDIFITGKSDVRVAKLYLNNGDGEYIEVLNTPFEKVHMGSVAFADIDNDNDQDLVITGISNSSFGSSSLYKNNGNGNFIEITEIPFIDVGGGRVLFNDIDNDNDQDVLIAGDTYSYGRIARIYLNNGQGEYTELLDNPFDGIEINDIAFIDFENDGDDDILISGENAIFFENDGNGNFTETTDLTFEDCFYGLIEIADIDNDNDKDVLIHGHYPDSYWTPTTNLYLNDGNGNFTKLNENLIGVYTGSVSFCDFDNDSDLDVLITGDRYFPGFLATTILYKNDGQGNFTEIENTPFEKVRESCSNFADVDNDGYQDLLISGNISNTNNSALPITELYYNINEIIDNIPPNLVEENASEMKFYPNPTNGIINFEFANTNIQKLIIFSITGKVVIERNNIHKNETVDLSDLSNGIFIIQIQSDDNLLTNKIVKE